MNIELLLVGKTAARLYAEGIDDYARRIGHYAPFVVRVIPELKNTASLSPQQQKEKEGELILKALAPKAFVALFDERGKELRSVEFAEWIAQRQLSAKTLTFIIGGPYGFSPAVYERADALLALSRMTLSHQMVRLFAIEQIYRACTIIKGERYHHE